MQKVLEWTLTLDDKDITAKLLHGVWKKAINSLLIMFPERTNNILYFVF